MGQATSQLLTDHFSRFDRVGLRRVLPRRDPPLAPSFLCVHTHRREWMERAPFDCALGADRCAVGRKAASRLDLQGIEHPLNVGRGSRGSIGCDLSEAGGSSGSEGQRVAIVERGGGVGCERSFGLIGSFYLSIMGGVLAGVPLGCSLGCRWVPSWLEGEFPRASKRLARVCKKLRKLCSILPMGSVV